MQDRHSYDALEGTHREEEKELVERGEGERGEGGRSEGGREEGGVKRAEGKGRQGGRGR